MRRFRSLSGTVCGEYDDSLESKPRVSRARCVQVTSGPSLRSLRVLSDKKWEHPKDHAHPRDEVYTIGLGWIAAVPVAVMNRCFAQARNALFKAELRLMLRQVIVISP
jgi:hypothetical protein